MHICAYDGERVNDSCYPRGAFHLSGLNMSGCGSGVLCLVLADD